MKFNDCRCGNNNFELTMKRKLQCTECGKDFNPFDAEMYKVMKDDNFHYFWAVFTPHFVERLEERVSGSEVEDVLKIAKFIEAKAKRNKFQCTKWKNKNIIWKYKYNEQRKRLELEFVSIVPSNKRATRLANGYYVKDVQYVDVSFKEEEKCKKIKMKNKK